MTHSHKLIDTVPSLQEALIMLLEGQYGVMEYGGVSFSLSGSKDDRAALAKVLKNQTLQQSPGSAQQTEARTVRTELKDGHVVALESYRPKQNVGGSTAKELREYAVGELARSWSWLSRAKFARWSLLQNWSPTVSASPTLWGSGSRA